MNELLWWFAILTLLYLLLSKFYLHFLLFFNMQLLFFQRPWLQIDRLTSPAVASELWLQAPSPVSWQLVLQVTIYPFFLPLSVTQCMYNVRPHSNSGFLTLIAPCRNIKLHAQFSQFVILFLSYLLLHWELNWCHHNI